MKRTILILTALIAVNVASAQFFVKAGAGYNLSTLTKATVDTYSDSTGNYSTATRHSFGNGIGIEAALGYDFTENLGFQLGARYLLATSPLEQVTDAPSYKRTITTEAKGALFLMPAFTLSSNGDKVNLYTRAGLTLPIGGTLEANQTVKGNNIDFESTAVIKGKMSIGYNAAIGFGLPLSDKLSFWAEVNGNFINVSGDTRELTKYFDNITGTDRLPNFSNSRINSEYVETVGPNDNTDATQPTKIVTEDAPFSSIGVAAGIKFSFGNSREDRREGKK